VITMSRLVNPQTFARWLRAVVRLGIIAILTACSNNPLGNGGDGGASGGEVTVRELTAEDTQCPVGGVEITTKSSVSYVCNGEPGAPGEAGSPGEAGQSVVITELDAGHEICAEGGAMLAVGTTTTYVCHGAAGATGAAGDPVTLTSLTPGDGNCPEGGTQFSSGGTTTFACHGTAGEAGLAGAAGDSVTTLALDPGHDVCTYGGSEFTVGASTTYACHGEPGSAGSGGGGKTVVDWNSTTLGDLVNQSVEGLTIATSTGYTVTVGWDGVVAPGQIWYGGAGCTGTAFLNAGGSAKKMSGNVVVRSASVGLMVPASVTAGYAVAAQGTFASIENPTCGNLVSSNYYGWELVATDATTVGLPATILPPLTIQ